MIRESFSRAAAKSAGSSGLDFLGAILRERPDLQGQMAYFPEQGKCAHTVFIGDEVFKGPKEDWAVHGFDKEHEILKALEEKGLPVPKVTCVGKEAIFYGMTRMPGVMLGDDFESHLTLEELRVFAKDAVNFMIGMARALPMLDGKFASHNDLNGGNILIDPITKKLSAIIDFGVSMYREKNVLCAYPSSSVSTDFRKMIEEEYALRKSEIPDMPAAAKRSPAGLHP